MFTAEMVRRTGNSRQRITMLAYSIRRMRSRRTPERSVRNPATNSDSDSVRSKGCLLDSVSRQRRVRRRREREEQIER